MRNFIGILLSCIAGFWGGVLASNDQVRASPPDVMRASSFELVDGAGTPVARWEADSDKTVRLSFLQGRDKTGLEIGLLSDGRPFLSMAGRDGKKRIVMELDQADKPMLGMGDERWEGRVRLGFIPPDTFPYSDWDHWGLLFRPVGSGRPAVGMGMANTRRSPAEPFLRIDGRSVR